MRHSAITLFTILALFCSSSVLAQRSTESPPQSRFTESDSTPMETVELPPIEVLGEKQELALRMIKSALQRGRVYGYEGRNQLYCWYERGNGSHLIYLFCALNKEINQAARYAQSFLGIPLVESPSYRHNIYRSQFSINPLQMERRLARLGPIAVNDEIVARVRRGESMPDNVPSEAEIARFAAALGEIKALRSANESGITTEAKLTAVIEENGLTVERYNHISKLVEQYGSLRKMVQDRL